MVRTFPTTACPNLLLRSHGWCVIYAKAIAGDSISEAEYAKYQTRLLVELGKIYAAKDFVMQLHFGAIRNNNKRMFAKLGADAGFDSIRINRTYPML